MKARIWFNRISALGWLIAGIISFPLGWAYSVAFVTVASIYANVKTDWGAAEAADDRTAAEALDEIRELREQVRDLHEVVAALVTRTL